MPNIEISGHTSLSDKYYLYFDGNVIIITQVFDIQAHVIHIPADVAELIELARENKISITIFPGNKPVADFWNSLGPARTGEALFDGKPIGKNGYIIQSVDTVISSH